MLLGNPNACQSPLGEFDEYLELGHLRILVRESSLDFLQARYHY